MIWTLKPIGLNHLMILDELGVERDTLRLDSLQEDLYALEYSGLAAKLRDGATVNVLLVELDEITLT